MLTRIPRMPKAGVFLALLCAAALPVAAQSNEILGEVRLHPQNGPAKTAGVWVDGTYVGDLSELKGAKKMFLLSGEHEISLREAGFPSVDLKIPGQPDPVETLAGVLAEDPR